MHYHGTPITPRARLLDLAGRNFCVSYAHPQDVAVCHEIGQSVMLDNGAFTFWRQGKATDWTGFAEWARPWLGYRTTWAVMPDVIDGTAEDNDQLITWLYANAKDVWERSAPVWHMHEPVERFQRLCHGYSRVCIGSSAQYATVGDSRWHRRMEQAMNMVCGSGPAPAWLHMLRGLKLAGGPYPFASADSTNIARNHAGNNTRGTPRKDVVQMATRIDAAQCPSVWVPRKQLQMDALCTQ